MNKEFIEVCTNNTKTTFTPWYDEQELVYDYDISSRKIFHLIYDRVDEMNEDYDLSYTSDILEFLSGYTTKLEDYENVPYLIQVRNTLHLA